MFPDDIPDPNPNNLPLNAETRRGLILGHVEALINRDYSAREALQFYRQHGLGIKSSDFNTLFFSFSTNLGKAQRVKALADRTQITEEYLGVGTINMRAKYLFIVETTYKDMTSENPLKGYFRFDTDELLSKGELEEIIKFWANQHDSYRGAEVLNVNLIKGYKVAA